MRYTYYQHKIAGSEDGSTNVMTCNGFKASLMRSEKLKGEITHSLPSGERIPVYPTDALSGAPDSWVRGNGSYVCPVDSDYGLWFDWRGNSYLNTAIIPSVKGMNPITGMKIDGTQLESYVNNCPVHNVPFLDNLICSECGYKWTDQNYVSSPNNLWWNGYRQPDGSVRQFFITDNESRDIASHVIGKGNTVPAFGFVFYETKEKRSDVRIRTPFPQTPVKYKTQLQTTGDWQFHNHPVTCNSLAADLTTSSSYYSAGTVRGLCRDVSVGAGAKIEQSLRKDNLGIGGWKDEPSAIIRLYFCFREQFESIVKNGGIKNLLGNSAGYLTDLPVG